AVDSLKKGAQKTASDAADAVDSLKKGAQKTASDAADALQKGLDEASKKIEEIVNKILETYKWYSEKWDQVLAYLKEKIAETDITENEWRVLRLGFDRAVRNAYNAGWLGKESWYTISRRADTVFETLRHVYRMAKEELTPAEFRREMVDLLIKNEAPEIISSLIAEKTGMDKETAEQIVGMVLVGVRQYLKEI
ncbi:MAG TPA: hypothetical protein DHV42_00310, partial [Lachnospiraceae bacterium]|nr:hypothetical protein [Lachnospiraceae bacterium]